jgi:hypothetical protein
MKRYLWSILAVVGLAATSAEAQIAALNGVCENGGRHATVQGLNATNFQLGVIPSCTISVYLTGTTTKATIFADSLGTPLANPFTGAVVGSTAPGQWLFYAATGVGYDVTMSGGIAPNTFPTPVTLTDLIVGGGGGGGGVSSFSSGNLLPLFTTNVANPTTSPALSFNPQSVPNLSFYGNVTPTINPPQFVTFVAGANISLTPSGGNTLTFSAAGGGCGPLAGDTTSTNCGTGNLATPFTPPAFNQAFGDNNLNTAGGTNLVSVGNANGNLFPNNEFVGIGDTNGASIPSGHGSNDVIGIGNNNIATVVGGIPDLICIGDANCQTISWLQDSVAIGNANFSNNVGTGNGTNLTEAVGIGLTNGWYINTGGSIVAIGQNNAGGIRTAGSTNVFEIIALGDSSAQLIGNNVSDVIAQGDGAAATLPTNSADIVAIGDGADKQCNTFTGCAGGIPNPVAVNDVIAIGDGTAGFNQASQIVAIGKNALGPVSVGAGVGTFSYNSGTLITAVGVNTLASNSTGSRNAAYGAYAGCDGYVENSSIGNCNQTGSNNSWFGYDSGPNTTTQLSNTAAFGYQAHNTASNQIVLGNSSMTTAYLFGTGTGCLSASAGGLISGSGSGCGAGGGGASNVTVNGGSTLTTANFGASPAAGTNGINVTWQVSAPNVSAEIVGDGVSTHFLNGTGTFTAPAGSGTVTSIATTAPLGGGPITTTGTLTCATCLVASSPAVGILHVAGATQTATSSAVNLATADVTGLLPIANGGTGTATPNLVAGANVTISGSWPNQTINAPAAGSGISGLTAGVVPLAGSPTTITANSHIDDGVTTAATLTATEPIAITGATHGMSIPAGTAVAGAANTVIYASDATSGFAEVNENNTGLARICTSANSVCTGGGGSAIVASAEVVSFTTTPTFSVATNVSRIVLTNNITSFTLAAGSDGQDKKLCFKQGAGPFTVVPPANVHGFFTIGTVNAEWNCQSFVYDNTDSIWLSTSPGTVNQ